jgi:transcriptional regulator with XRE-family HTH domain
MIAIITALNHRRLDLGLSCLAVAKRAGLSLRTVQRVLSGKEDDAGLRTVSAIARALETTLTLAHDDLNAVLRRQAEKKAVKVLALVQGTSALEGQAIDQDAAVAMKERTVRDLLRGSPRKLWAD